MEKMTPAQERLLRYVLQHQEVHGKPPSYREMAEAMGWASVNSVARALEELERQGVIERVPGRNRSVRVVVDEGLPRVRLAGVIAAGRPIEATEQMEWLEVPPYLAGRGETFALRVSGDSMQDDGILDGDLILVERRSVAENGEIVVALLDGSEATVKRFSLQDAVVVLTPANATMQPMRFAAGRVAILGVVTGQMRSYRRKPG
ncbi:MAG: transcriptional repressor LexA [Magnetococcales bacterium]|nr:transcriptional repressor LexA [Magnetococcales bacterium]